MILYIMLKKKKIFALKIPSNDDYRSIELIERERANYLLFTYPFVLHYYGYVERNEVKNLILEFVEGETLEKYELKRLNKSEIYCIILELMLTLQYFHSKGYKYRDLHIGNTIIGEDKHLTVIDFISFN